MAGRDGKGWEHPTLPQRGTVGPGQSLQGARSRWARGLRGPTGDVPPAWWVQPPTSPRRQERAEEPQPQLAPLPSDTWGCPQCKPDHQHSGRASPVASAFGSKRVCWDTAWDHPRAQGEGCQAPHGRASPQRLPPVGRGRAQAASWIWANPKPLKLCEQSPAGWQQQGTLLGVGREGVPGGCGCRTKPTCTSVQSRRAGKSPEKAQNPQT